MDYTSEHATIIKDIDGTTDVTFDKGMKNADATVPLVKKFNVDTGCDEYEAAGTKSDSRPYPTLDLQAAWDNGKIAHPDYPLSHHNAKKIQPNHADTNMWSVLPRRGEEETSYNGARQGLC
jgi:hypothetical protein